MVKVAFLFDKKNQWISKYFKKKDFKTFTKFEVSFFDDHNQVRGFEVVFILGFTEKLNKDFLRNNKLCFVIHESDLPKGRGFSPVQWQILNGKSNINVCMIKINENVDAGEICLKDNIKLNGDELYKEIRAKQAKVSKKIIYRFLNIYPKFKLVKQKGEKSYYRKRTKNDSELDVKKTIKEQFNLLRICNNDEWPAFFILKGQKYKLKILKDND